MSMIKSRFLSLSSGVKLWQAGNKPKEEVIKEKPQKQESRAQNEALIPDMPKENALGSDFLLTYRGININQMETAESKTPVTEATCGVCSKTPEPEEKPVFVDKSIVLKSSLASAYKASSTRVMGTSSYSSGLSAVQRMAASDLRTLSNTIKAELRRELGAKYDEKSVEEAIEKAIQRTIKEFTDNKTQKSKLYKAQVSDNGFVFSRTTILGTKGKYSYNVQSLSNKFIENLNGNFRVQFEQNKAKNESVVYEKKAELLEKKEEIKAAYSLSSNYMTFNSNFDKAFEKALDSLNTGNYKNADDVILESLNNSLVNLNCKTPDELQNRLDELFTATAKNYHEMYCPSVSEKDFGSLFNNAKNEILSSIIGKKDCDLKALSNSFDDAVLKAVNVYASSENSANIKSVSSTRSSAAAVSSTKPSKVKGSNGYTISYEPNKTDKSNTGTITITGKDGVSSTLSLNMSDEYGLSKLMDMLKDLKPEILQDLVKEADKIDIVNKLPGEGVGSTARAAADAKNGKIYFVYDMGGWYHNGETFDPFTEKIFAHEIGHMIDSMNNQNTHQSDNTNELYRKLTGLLPAKGSRVNDKAFKDQYYAFKNINEFFAEYYAYKMCGDTDNKFKELLDELKSCKKINELKERNGIDKKTIKSEAKEIKEIIDKLTKSFDEIIKNTRNKSDIERNNSKKSNKEQTEKLPSVEIPVPPQLPPLNENQNQTPGEQDINKNDQDNTEKLFPPPPITPPNTPQVKPPVNNDNENLNPQDKNPPAEPDSVPPAPNPDSPTPNSTPKNNTVEKGKETYKPFEQKTGTEGINNLPSTNAQTLSNQKAQELYEKYGDGYDINVTATTNPDGTITIEYSVTKNDTNNTNNNNNNHNDDGTGSDKGTGKDNAGGNLPNSPTGDITGNTDAGKLDRENTPGLDKDGKIPGQDKNVDSDQGGRSSGNYIPGTNINLDDTKYHNPDGSLDMGVLIKDLVAANQAYTTSDPEEIREILNWAQNKYGNVSSTDYGHSIGSTWDNYWSELGFGYAGSVNTGTNEETWGSSTGPQDDDYFNSITASYGAAQQAAQELQNQLNQQAPPSTAGYTNGYDSGSTDGYSNGYDNGYNGGYNYTHKGTAGYSNGYYNGY